MKTRSNNVTMTQRNNVTMTQRLNQLGFVNLINNLIKLNQDVDTPPPITAAMTQAMGELDYDYTNRVLKSARKAMEWK